MTRIDGQGPMRIPETPRPDSAQARAARGPREADPAPQRTGQRLDASEAPQVHDAANLRRAVADLVNSGDLDATSDGNVRDARVERARRNSERGAYSDQSVLADIVDRLLQQWEI